MKKSLLVTLALSLVLVAAGCSKTTENTTEEGRFKNRRIEFSVAQ